MYQKRKPSVAEATIVLALVKDVPEFPEANIECQKWIAHHVRYAVEAQKRSVV
jgi:hypothetical protein